MQSHQAEGSKPRESAAPVVLIVGATGLVGRHIVEELDREPGGVHVRLAARRPEQVELFRTEGRDAVLLDLDDPGTFAAALAGVDRLFLLTGYTVAMLAQSKTLVDAARKARVRHVVHLGVFGNWDCTDPHLAWHQLVERYIEASGVAWTHLHPNVFMELLPAIMPIRDGTFPVFWGDRRVGWIAARDIGAVGAAVLRDGPEKHGGQDYWLSTEVAGGLEIAAVLTEVLGRPIHCEIKGPDEFQATVAATGDYPVEPWYAAGTLEFLRQVLDGRMGYIGTVRDDVPFVVGRPSTTLRRWVEENRERLVKSG
jgi:NAD(P)H dehydrogenase (quinone)